jgi:DNA gyrase subunit A
MICVEEGSKDTVLVISNKGYGKRTLLDDENGEPIYRITNRGGKGVKTMNLTDKTGYLIGMEAVNDDQDLMLITKSGTAIRMPMTSISVLGRATQGVKLIELQKRNDTLMFGCTVPKEEVEEQTLEEATPEETTTEQ